MTEEERTPEKSWGPDPLLTDLDRKPDPPEPEPGTFI